MVFVAVVMLPLSLFRDVTKISKVIQQPVADKIILFYMDGITGHWPVFRMVHDSSHKVKALFHSIRRPIRLGPDGRTPRVAPFI